MLRVLAACLHRLQAACLRPLLELGHPHPTSRGSSSQTAGRIQSSSQKFSHVLHNAAHPLAPSTCPPAHRPSSKAALQQWQHAATLLCLRPLDFVPWLHSHVAVYTGHASNLLENKTTRGCSKREGWLPAAGEADGCRAGACRCSLRLLWLSAHAASLQGAAMEALLSGRRRPPSRRCSRQVASQQVSMRQKPPPHGLHARQGTLQQPSSVQTPAHPNLQPINIRADRHAGYPS